jgi:hypothetical protein
MLNAAGSSGVATHDGRPVTDWTDDPAGRLSSVDHNVRVMESALASEALPVGSEAAAELVALTTGLLEELELEHSGDPDTDAKLIATLRVYRNAAFAYRKLAGVSGEPDPAMGDVCAAMIEHGHDLRALLDQRPDRGN